MGEAPAMPSCCSSAAAHRRITTPVNYHQLLWDLLLRVSKDSLLHFARLEGAHLLDNTPVERSTK